MAGPAVELVGGRSGAAPLALIHGVGTDRTIWDRSAPLLSSGRYLALVDLPGFGDSPAPTGDWTISAAAEACADGLEARLGGRFDLLGSSLGGAVALALAARRPGLVRRLVLVAPAGFRPAPDLPASLVAALAPALLASRRLAGLRVLGNRTARRALLAGSVADGGSLDPDDARLMLEASTRAHSLRPALRAAATARLDRELRELAVPVGLLWGTLDRVIPAHTAERLLELRPEAPIELVTGAGHIPQLERPEEFCAAVERLLEQLG